METDYAEKRDFFRINLKVDCAVEFKVQGSERSEKGTVKNLSGKGLFFWADRMIEPETQLQITMRPIQPLTPPLEAKAVVLRCDPAEGGRYAVACQFDSVE